MAVWCLRAWDRPGTTVPASAPFFTLSFNIPLSTNYPFSVCLICFYPFSIWYPDFSISCYTFCFPRPSHLPPFSSSACLLGLSHDKKLLHTVIHPALLFFLLLSSALLPGWKWSVTQTFDSITAAQLCSEALGYRLKVVACSSSTANCLTAVSASGLPQISVKVLPL